MQKPTVKQNALPVIKPGFDSNTSNLWRHLESYHLEKDPRSNKSKSLAEGQSTLDSFVGQIEVSSKVSVIINIKQF